MTLQHGISLWISQIHLYIFPISQIHVNVTYVINNSSCSYESVLKPLRPLYWMISYLTAQASLQPKDSLQMTRICAVQRLLIRSMSRQLSRALSIPCVSGQSIKIWPKLGKVRLTLKNNGRCMNEDRGSQTPDCIHLAVWRSIVEVMHAVLNIQPLPIFNTMLLILSKPKTKKQKSKL